MSERKIISVYSHLKKSYEVFEMRVLNWRICGTVILTGTLHVSNCCKNQIDMYHVIWETQPSYLVIHGHFV
jgi:hypothetical protein